MRRFEDTTRTDSVLDKLTLLSTLTLPPEWLVVAFRRSYLRLTRITLNARRLRAVPAALVDSAPVAARASGGKAPPLPSAFGRRRGGVTVA